jgi:hypothetical protein
MMLASWYLSVLITICATMVHFSIVLVGFTLKMEDSVRAMGELLEGASILSFVVLPYLGLVVALDIGPEVFRRQELLVTRLGTAMCCVACALFFNQA